MFVRLSVSNVTLTASQALLFALDASIPALTVAAVAYQVYEKACGEAYILVVHTRTRIMWCSVWAGHGRVGYYIYGIVVKMLPPGTRQTTSGAGMSVLSRHSSITLVRSIHAVFTSRPLSIQGTEHRESDQGTRRHEAVCRQ